MLNVKQITTRPFDDMLDGVYITPADMQKFYLKELNFNEYIMTIISTEKGVSYYLEDKNGNRIVASKLGRGIYVLSCMIYNHVIYVGAGKVDDRLHRAGQAVKDKLRFDENHSAIEKYMRDLFSSNKNLKGVHKLKVNYAPYLENIHNRYANEVSLFDIEKQIITCLQPKYNVRGK